MPVNDNEAKLEVPSDFIISTRNRIRVLEESAVFHLLMAKEDDRQAESLRKGLEYYSAQEVDYITTEDWYPEQNETDKKS